MTSGLSDGTGDAGGACLVVGGDSMIGRVLAGTLDRERAGRVFTTTRRPGTAGECRLHLDLNDSATWDAVLARPWSSAILCAAMARLDACHADPEAAMRINAHGPVALAAALAARGCYVVLLSTNQVFDGRLPSPSPMTPVSPTTAYGRSKAEAERGMIAMAGRPGMTAPGVLRLSKVVEPGMPLLAGWIDRLRHRDEVLAARDMSLAPLPVAQVVEALRRMTGRRTAGIVQLASAAEISYVEAARHVARRIGASPDLVRPVDSVAAGFLKDQPPPHTLMDGSRAAAELGILPLDPFETLDHCIAPLLKHSFTVQSHAGSRADGELDR